jgi:L-fuculose-phosphate aldolase
MPEELQRELVAAGELLFAAGVMSHSGHGNLSARLSGEAMLLGSLPGLADLATVGLDGSEREGQLDPATVEIVPMHGEVYLHRPEVGAVLHTHSPAATAFAVAHRTLPCRYEALLRFGQAADVPVVPWAPRGSKESVTGILDTLDAHPDTRAVLLANHGLLVLGDSPRAAAALVVALEEAAILEVEAAALGGSQPFPPGALEAVRAAMSRAR